MTYKLYTRQARYEQFKLYNTGLCTTEITQHHVATQVAKILMEEGKASEVRIWQQEAANKMPVRVDWFQMDEDGVITNLDAR